MDIEKAVSLACFELTPVETEGPLPNIVLSKKRLADGVRRIILRTQRQTLREVAGDLEIAAIGEDFAVESTLRFRAKVFRSAADEIQPGDEE